VAVFRFCSLSACGFGIFRLSRPPRPPGVKQNYIETPKIKAWLCFKFRIGRGRTIATKFCLVEPRFPWGGGGAGHVVAIFPPRPVRAPCPLRYSMLLFTWHAVEEPGKSRGFFLVRFAVVFFDRVEFGSLCFFRFSRFFSYFFFFFFVWRVLF